MQEERKNDANHSIRSQNHKLGTPFSIAFHLQSGNIPGETRRLTPSLSPYSAQLSFLNQPRGTVPFSTSSSEGSPQPAWRQEGLRPVTETEKTEWDWRTERDPSKSHPTSEREKEVSVMG